MLNPGTTSSGGGSRTHNTGRSSPVALPQSYAAILKCRIAAYSETELRAMPPTGRSRTIQHNES